jgi:hypothetical protein
MSSNEKLKNKRVILWFLVLFPILPTYFKIYGFHITNVLSFTLFVSALLFRYGKIKNNEATLVNWLIGIWAIFRCYSYISHGQFLEWIWFLLKSIVAGSIVIRAIDSRQFFIKIINSLVYTAGILSIFGLIEAIWHFNVFELLNNSGAVMNYNPLRFGLLRIISFHSQTIVYCVYIMFMMSLCFYAITLSCNRNKKNAFRFIYILLGINAMMTLSRSAIIVLILCQLLLLYRCGFVKFVTRVAAIAMLGVIVMFVIQLFDSTIAEAVANIFYMFLAVFDDRYTLSIASNFGNDNLYAFGNRFDLYSWVFQSMGDKWLTGYGSSTKFLYVREVTNYGLYFWNATKQGIEVQYLNLLYHYGIIGLVSEVAVYLGLLRHCIINKLKSATWESKLSFNFVCLAVFLFYFIQFFAVNSSSEYLMFYVLIFLLLAYNKHTKYEEG